MTSKYVEEAAIIVKMSSALQKVGDISDESKRAGAYMAACIEPVHMIKLDKSAFYAEKCRRRMMR